MKLPRFIFAMLLAGCGAVPMDGPVVMKLTSKNWDQHAAQAWVDEVGKKFNLTNTVIVMAHGGTVQGQWWWFGDDGCGPVEALVRDVVKSHPKDAVVCLIICNADGFELRGREFRNVYFGRENLWVLPDSAVLFGRGRLTRRQQWHNRIVEFFQLPIGLFRETAPDHGYIGTVMELRPGE